MPVIEVGHGNGLGASSLQVGWSKLSDDQMLDVVRESLSESRLGVFMCPGWGTAADLDNAVSKGADLVRIGTHCTEANVTERYLRLARDLGIEAHGVLLMSHMASPEILAEQCRILEQSGAQAVGIFDSAGNYLPEDVKSRISQIVDTVSVPVIFHGHNNLGMAVANSIAAVEAGAGIIDGTARGFGAGAGNTQLEVLVAVLDRMGYSTGINLEGLLRASDVAEKFLMPAPPTIDSVSLVSGLAGVFSGFKSRVIEIANAEGISAWDLFFELGKRQAVAGQEDLIRESAQRLKSETLTT